MIINLENIPVSVAEVNQKTEFKWTVVQTKILHDIYKKFRKKVSTLQINTFKQLWNIIGAEMKVKIPNITYENC